MAVGTAIAGLAGAVGAGLMTNAKIQSQEKIAQMNNANDVHIAQMNNANELSIAKLNDERERYFKENEYSLKLADLEAAGLNPALALGSSSIPSIASRGVNNASTAKGNSSIYEATSGAMMQRAINSVASKHRDEIKRELMRMAINSAKALIKQL